jgi:signal transduction histidine kinase
LHEEISALLRITAHDLKNPIQGISGLLEIMQIMLNNDDIDKETFDELITSSISSANQANSIIMDILDLNKLKRGDIQDMHEDVNLNELASVIFTNNKFKAEKKNIELVFNNFQNEVLINSDKDKLSRIIDNILSNAIKFTEPSKKVRFECNEDDSDIVFAIHDEGPGIPKEEQKNLFKRYAKLSNKPTGDEVSTGLGMSIVKEFSDLLGYEISFESETGKGSSFYLKIKKQT